MTRQRPLPSPALALVGLTLGALLTACRGSEAGAPPARTAAGESAAPAGPLWLRPAWRWVAPPPS